jgi:C1A family cysteine protease
VFLAPEYDPSETLSPTYEADLDAITATVLDLQSAGENLPVQEIAENGTLDLGDVIVQLIEVYSNPCPPDLDLCDETDSAVLGVGPNALVASLEDLEASVVSQGERGSCVAFAVSAGVELLLDRAGTPFDIGEQTTYLLGKDACDEFDPDIWEGGGLYPDVAIEGFATTPMKLVGESTWPYNPYDHDCTEYQDVYPDATCSETEAQGGGPEGKEPDPRYADAEGVKIAEAHELYASLGRIKQALYRGYPVVIAINANSDFQVSTKKEGVVSWVFEVASCGASCGHAILAVGYQDDPNVDGGGYLIVKNSWGEGWGDGGLAYATYEWVENSLFDAQAIVTVE